MPLKRKNYETKLLFFAVVIVVLVMLKSVAGTIEGMVFPVTSELQGVVIEEGRHPAEVRIRGHFEKYRGCEYIGQEWRLGSRKHYATVDREVVRSPKTYPAGSGIPFGPVTLAVSRKQLITVTHAVALHRCHPLWVTVTSLYSS